MSCATCGLDERADSIIGTLSLGYRQRVGLAQALLHDPQVLILDEPTIGLDPNQIREVRGLIKTLAGEHTVMLSTHILPEAQVTCQRVIIINHGQIVAEDTSAALTAQIRSAETMWSASAAGMTVASAPRRSRGEGCASGEARYLPVETAVGCDSARTWPIPS